MTTASSTSPAPAINPMLVIVCGCLIAMIAFGVRSTMGLFTAPVTEANGWGRETFALAMALQNLIWGVAQPFAGAFADNDKGCPNLRMRAAGNGIVGNDGEHGALHGNAAAERFCFG